MPDTYYISNDAYSGLLQLAASNGFTKITFKSHRGLSEFLDKLSYSEFIDTRPPLVKQYHEQLLRAERRPHWSKELEAKRPRYLTLEDNTIYNYVDIALRLGIHIHKHLTFGGRLNRSAISICGLTLEAIGIQWITPIHMPTWIAPERRRTKTSSPSRGRFDALLTENPYYIYLRRRPSRKEA